MLKTAFLLPYSVGRKFWSFPIFAGNCASGHRRFHSRASPEQKSDITDSFGSMMFMILTKSPSGAGAAEAKRAQAAWVLLDRQLKHEQKRCMEELQCNIVVMKRSL